MVIFRRFDGPQILRTLVQKEKENQKGKSKGNGSACSSSLPCGLVGEGLEKLGEAEKHQALAATERMKMDWKVDSEWNAQIRMGRRGDSGGAPSLRAAADWDGARRGEKVEALSTM